MNTDPAYAYCTAKDSSNTNKEHVEFIQHSDLNGVTKMNTDPAYAGFGTTENDRLTYSTTTM